MNLRVNLTNESVVYKESGELPDEFTPYVFIHKFGEEYSILIGFYEPDYNNGEGGVYDGIMGHMDWSEVIAWKRLREDDFFIEEDTAAKHF